MKQFKIITALILCLSLSACSLLQKETEAPAESPVIPLEEQSAPEQINTAPVFDLSEEDDPSFSGELADPDPTEPEQSEATEAIDDLLAQLEEEEVTTDTDVEDAPEDTATDSEVSEGPTVSDEGTTEPDGGTIAEVLDELPIEEPADELPAEEPAGEPVEELPKEELVHELPNTGIFLEDD